MKNPFVSKILLSLLLFLLTLFGYSYFQPIESFSVNPICLPSRHQGYYTSSSSSSSSIRRILFQQKHPSNTKDSSTYPICGITLHDSKQGEDESTTTNGDDTNEDDDPWAQYTLRTDDDDDEIEEEEEEEEDAWLDKIPGARALSQDPSLVEFSSSFSNTDNNNNNPKMNQPSSVVSSFPKNDSNVLYTKDHFYSSFDDEKFINMQKEYSAKARNMNLLEYDEDQGKRILQNQQTTTTSSTASPTTTTTTTTTINPYVQTNQVEKKSVYITTLQQHLQHQQTVFDTMSTNFYTKEEDVNIQLVLKHITKRIIQQMIESHWEEEKYSSSFSKIKSSTRNEEEILYTYQILDVGCGTGSLFQHLIQTIKESKIQVKVTGIDISLKMIDYAKIHVESILDDIPLSSSSIQFDFIHEDFTQYIMGTNGKEENQEVKVEGIKNKYDAVIFNSCFGNFYDLGTTLTAAVTCLKPHGILVITHPLGAEFVRKLNEEDPETVPHHLPTILDFRAMIRKQQLPLIVLDFIEDVDLLNYQKEIQNFPFYYASAKKTLYQPLKHVLRLRGPVDTGYDRGGKKLGFPTANLPCTLFSNALEDLPNGVYFGWAVIEDGKNIRSDHTRSGRNIWHKAVVNVGLSPTFVGEENKQKIVEAHLIVEDNPIRGDFYNETMRLALSGFIRPEMKFNSFPDLIAAITNDVSVSKKALSVQPFVALRADPFITDPCKRINNTMVDKGQFWIGKSGGDETASWEWEDFDTALRATPLARWVI